MATKCLKVTARNEHERCMGCLYRTTHGCEILHILNEFSDDFCREAGYRISRIHHPVTTGGHDHREILRRYGLE